MSVPFNFGYGVFSGLVSNIGLMKLNSLHKGCINVCTLSQFMFGFSQTLLSSTKRSAIFSSSARQIPLKTHFLFALMFFIGPWCGNFAVSMTNADFYPVFLVVRSCGSVTSMIIGYFFYQKQYTFRQCLGVLIITSGAAITTLGCYNGSQQFKLSQLKTSQFTEEDMKNSVTSDKMFVIGVVLLLLNLINDSGLAVMQAAAFSPFLALEEVDKNKQLNHHRLSVTDESMAMMSFIGTILMSLVAGKEVFHYIRIWYSNPTWYHLDLSHNDKEEFFFLLQQSTLDHMKFNYTSLLNGLKNIFFSLLYPLIGNVYIPLEFVYLTLNFVGNWNSRLASVWLNGHASVILGALVPMFYRLLATIISTQIAGVNLPLYTWFGIFLVFIGSILYILQKPSGGSSHSKKKLS